MAKTFIASLFPPCFSPIIYIVVLKFYLFFSTSMQRVLGDGLLVVRKIENVAAGPNNRPKLPCIIAECGEM
jgi:hypothetical protein